MTVGTYVGPLARLLVWAKRMSLDVRRIADALERAHPATRPAPRHVELSVATTEDYNRGWEDRHNAASDEA